MRSTPRTALENRKNKRQGSRSLAFTIGGAVALIGGGTLAFFLLRDRGPTTPLPLGATITPADALLSLSVETDAGPWRQLNSFGNPESQAQWQTQLQALENDFLAPFDLSYEADIQPWVGAQIGLTQLSPAAEDAAIVGDRATVWFLPIRNAQRAQSLLNRTAEQGGAAQTRTYKDVPIQTFQGKDGKSLAIAVFDGKLLVATNGPKALDQIVDTYRGQPSLAKAPRFAEALQSIQTGNSFAQLYVNLPATLAGATEKAGYSLSQDAIRRIQSSQGLGATLSLTDEGLKAQSITWLNPDAKVERKAAGSPQALPKLLPASTLMMAAGGNFQQLWDEYSQGTEAQLFLPLNPNKIQDQLYKSTGINFKEDFVSWMDGEFTAALVPVGESNAQGVGIAVLAKASDRQKADAALKKLDEAMRDRYNLLLSEAKVGNRTVINWKVPPNLPLASRGWLDSNVAFFTFGAPIAEQFAKPQNNTLVNSEAYQSTVPAGFGPKNGLFFLDMPRTAALLDNSPLLPKLADRTKTLTQAIEQIGFTAAVENDWSTRYNLTVKLKTP